MKKIKNKNAIEKPIEELCKQQNYRRKIKQ